MIENDDDGRKAGKRPSAVPARWLSRPGRYRADHGGGICRNNTRATPSTIKQHMSAIRMLFSWLTEKGILAMNPALEFKTEKFSRNEGKTPDFETEQVQKVLDKIDSRVERVQ